MRIIGHRGVPAHVLENTLDSFQAALDLGLSELEFDVRMSRDGIPVIIHDASLKRTHGLSKRVAHTLAKDLMDLGVPTFDQVMEFLEQHKLHATVEIKTCSSGAIGYIANSAARLGLTVSSFDVEWIEQASQANPDVSIQWTVERLNQFQPLLVPSLMSTGRIKEIAVDIDHVSQEGVARARNWGLEVLAYTIRTPQQAARAQALGLDGVFADDPEQVMAWLAHPSSRQTTRPNR